MRGVGAAFFVAFLIELVFSVGTADAVTFKTIYSFCAESNCADGALPNGGLAMDADGNLYGTTQLGGSDGHGMIFELQPGQRGKWNYKQLWSFCHQQQCKKGNSTVVPVIVDNAGNLYGAGPATTGKDDQEIFKLSADGTYATLYQFDTNAGPDGPLTYRRAAPGAPYDGRSSLSGTLGSGVFSLTPINGGWTEATVYEFCSLPNCEDGNDSVAPPLRGYHHRILGTTVTGGPNQNGGVIYEIKKDKGQWIEQVLHNFCSQSGCTDGSQPRVSVAEDKPGNIFGTTATGGQFGQGVIYELSNTNQFSVLYSFCSKSFCPDGAAPQATVTLGPDDNLFGTTSGGGTGYGVLYWLAPGQLIVLHTFCSESGCSDGEVPTSQLLMDHKGRLFGTTRGGGNGSGEGTVFEFKF
ncbi:MAG TPA: choice-of-anchor tandem repeat GloVer-containing protein [Rhizomicrobium sp.]|jgi:uncharacterized repeat protein (TIGR03803 family)